MSRHNGSLSGQLEMSILSFAASNLDEAHKHESRGQFTSPCLSLLFYWQVAPGGHHGIGPPPSAIAVVADSASNMVAARIKRISVFFIMLLCLGWEPSKEAYLS
jgi:hypothetical protein